MKIDPNLPVLSRDVVVQPDPAINGLGVFVTSQVEKGSWLGFFTGSPTPVRSRMSLQFGADLFIEPGPSDPLRNLNHACEPTARFVGRDLFAERTLVAGDPVTLDYNLHESEMAEPFYCRCGAKSCVGDVAGWIHLSEGAKRAREAMAGLWLLRQT